MTQERKKKSLFHNWLAKYGVQQNILEPVSISKLFYQTVTQDRRQ